jgi:hypothetical protein
MRPIALFALVIVALHFSVAACGGRSPTSPTSQENASVVAASRLGSGSANPVVEAALPEGLERYIGGSLGLGPARATVTCGAEHFELPVPPGAGFTFIGVSTITRHGTTVSGSNRNVMGGFVDIEGEFVDATLHLRLRGVEDSIGLTYTEEWNAALRSEGDRYLLTGQSSGSRKMNDGTCVTDVTWSGVPLSAEIFFVPPPPPPQGPVAWNVVISEFRSRGPRGTTDEFVEIRNDSLATVLIGGWRLLASDASAGTSELLTVQPGAAIGPGCRYLFVNGRSAGYSGSVGGDEFYQGDIADDGGLALFRTDGTIADAVGMSLGSQFLEGMPLSPLSGDANRSYARTSSDSNDNSRDFSILTPSNPQNRVSVCGVGDGGSPTPGPIPGPGPNPGPGPVDGGTMTALIDGVPWIGTITVATIATGNNLVVSATGSPGMTTIALNSPAQIGTHTVGPTSTVVGSVITSPTVGWLAAGPIGSGTMTISTLTATTATGTFSFTLVPNIGTGPNRVVTNGTFSARLPTP